MSNHIDDAWNDGRRFGCVQCTVRGFVAGICGFLLGLLVLGLVSAL